MPTRSSSQREKAGARIDPSSKAASNWVGSGSGGRRKAALHHAAPAENAARNRQMHVSPLLTSRLRTVSRPQPSPLAFDALLLNSFDSAVAAAGDTDSSWLCSGSGVSSTADGGEEVSSAPRLPSPARQQAPDSGSAPDAPPSGSPCSPNALLLPHLQSAGAGGTSWLTGGSPGGSPGMASSPSLALSRSISLSLGAPTPGAAPALAAAALAPDSPRDGETTSSSSGASSPVTLRALLPPSRSGTPGSTALPAPSPPPHVSPRSPGWWPSSGRTLAACAASPQALPAAAAREEHGRPGGQADEQPEQQVDEGMGWQVGEEREAGARVPSPAPSLEPPAATASPDRGSTSASPAPLPQQPKRWEEADGERGLGLGRPPPRRHSSPFLSRDCSRVDVFCPDRYARWTQRSCSDASDDGGSGSPDGSPASDVARRRRLAALLERSEAGGGGGLRAALGAALRWVSDRLKSHPIELTPSKAASFGSAASSLGGTPASSPSPAASRYFTPGSTASRGTPAGASWHPARRPPGWQPRAEAPDAAAGSVPRHLRYSPEGAVRGAAVSHARTASPPSLRRVGLDAAASSPQGSSSRSGGMAPVWPPAGGKPPTCPLSSGGGRPPALRLHLSHEMRDWQLPPADGCEERPAAGGSEQAEQGEESQEVYHSAACCASPAGSPGSEVDSGEAAGWLLAEATKPASNL